MKVKYLVSNHMCCIGIDGIIHKRDDIVNLPNELANNYIEHNIVEPFSYSISDDEIKRLYEEFNETNDFKRLVDILITAYSYSNERKNFLLDDNSVIEFELIPETRDQWYYYNTQMSKFFISEFPKCSIEGLKNDFKRKRENFKYLDTLRKKELEYIEKALTEDDPKGISYWYDMVISGEIPSNEKDYKIFLSRQMPYGLEIYLQGKAIAEYEMYLNNLITTKGTRDQTINITTLKQIFRNESEYRSILALLVEKGYCNEGTFIWKDRRKGNLKVLTSLIKQLHSKGYYIKRPSNYEVKLIAKNTFGIDIGIDTIKQTKKDSIIYNFIPNAESQNK